MTSIDRLSLERAGHRPRADVMLLVAIGAGLGWAWLIASIASIMATADMTALGPGMGVFNRFNQLADLPASMRASLVALCTPSADRPWSLAGLLTVLVMWNAMVLAMMLPSAAPVLAAEEGRGPHAAPVLAAGYLSAWFGFSVAAALLQICLGEARLLHAAMAPMTEVLAATTMAAAGIYQFTPFKTACLARCRNPAPAFFADPPGVAALYRRGFGLGLDCLGCCWALMTVMFAVGVMNLIWIAGLGAVMATEKLTAGHWLRWSIGVGLIAAAVALLAGTPVGTRLLGLA